METMDEAKLNDGSMVQYCYPTLYHGTSALALASMVRDGIRGRAHHGITNWKATIESNEETVYLSDAYALFFAVNAERGNEGGAILEINTRGLDPRLFQPDEDFLEQASRGHPVIGGPSWLSESKDMQRRTRWFRKHAKMIPFARVSLECMGTVGYAGVIPWKAVKRVALLSHEQLMHASIIWDPTISTLNYKFVGERHRRAMRSIFDPNEMGDPQERAKLAQHDEFMAVQYPDVKKPAKHILTFNDLEEGLRPVLYQGSDVAKIAAHVSEFSARRVEFEKLRAWRDA